MSHDPLVMAAGDDTGDAVGAIGCAAALARRFSAGATLWCLAPEWPEGARRIVAAFTHPDILGKRALPAVPVDVRDPASALRPLVRPGDVLLAVGSAAEPRSVECLRRAEAWGLTRVWLGSGPSPPAGFADHVIWVDGKASEVTKRYGELARRAHHLWELTHLVLEDGGVPGAGTEPECGGASCRTCSDQASLGEVRAASASGHSEVVVGGYFQTVDTSLVAPVAPGDLVLVHAGVAIAAVELRS